MLITSTDAEQILKKKRSLQPPAHSGEVSPTSTQYFHCVQQSDHTPKICIPN